MHGMRSESPSARQSASHWQAMQHAPFWRTWLGKFCLLALMAGALLACMALAIAFYGVFELLALAATSFALPTDLSACAAPLLTAQRPNEPPLWWLIACIVAFCIIWASGFVLQDHPWVRAGVGAVSGGALAYGVWQLSAGAFDLAWLTAGAGSGALLGATAQLWAEPLASGL